MDVVEAAIKRQRTNNEAGCACEDKMMDCSLLLLPREVLEHLLQFLDANSLQNIAQVCKAFRAFDTQTGLRLVEKIARSAVLEAAGEQGERWRRRTWLSRLHVEDCGVGFDKFQWSNIASSPTAGVPPQYRFLPPTSPGSYLHIKLEGMGPKLLVSDLSTADQPVLRWRLVVRGNTAVEFGVVPLNMVDDDKSLHKCQQEEKKFDKLTGPLVDAERPTGFCSSITVGSMLPFKTAIMKGSVVELLARRGRLEILVQNPPDGQELYWHNTRTVPKPYKGPREVRFEQDFSPNHDVKLALTSWAHGAFDVLHPAPGSRLLGPAMQTAWHLSRAPSSTAERSSSRSKRSLKRSRSGEEVEQVHIQQAMMPFQPAAEEPADAARQQQQGHPLQPLRSAPALQQQQQQQPQQQQPVQQPAVQARQEQQAQQVVQQPAAVAVAAPVAAPHPAAAAMAGLSAAPAQPSSPTSEESTTSREGQLLA